MGTVTTKKTKTKGGKKTAAKKATAIKASGTRTRVAATKSAPPKKAKAGAKKAVAKKPAAKKSVKSAKRAPVKSTKTRKQAPAPVAVIEAVGAPEEFGAQPIGELHEIITAEPEQLVREEIVPSPVAEDGETSPVEMPDMSLDSIIDEDCIAPDESFGEEELSVPDSAADMAVEAKAGAETRNDTGELQLVCFSLGEEEYGVDIYRIQEINRSAGVTQIPEAPFYVKGIINLRGNVIPILDLRLRLGLEQKEEDKNTRIIVFDHKSKLVGITVDGVTEVLRVPAKDLEDVPNQATTTGGEFLQGIIRQTDRLILVIDCEKILTM